MRTNHIQRLSTPTTSKRDPNFLIYIFLYDSLQQAINNHAFGKVLDVGCGNKPYKVWFDAQPHVKEYIGCDVVQSSLNQVDVMCEATELPFENLSFDTVFTTQTVEHVFDHKRMLSEIYRVLRPGGKLILSGPMYWPHHEVPHDYFRFTRYGIEALFRESNMDVLSIVPNGGKYALWGLATFHTFPPLLVQNRPIKWLINSICYFLDKKYPSYDNTANFVAVAQKKL